MSTPADRAVGPATPASRPGRSRWRRGWVAGGAVGVLLAGGAAFAATNWVVGLNAGSSGQGQSATISAVSITAVASPAATNLLYPGGTGDVVVQVSNPNRARSRSSRSAYRPAAPTPPATPTAR